MDFGTISNPTAGNSPYVDQKGQQWGNVQGDILAYLSDVNALEQFANTAQNAEQMAEYVEPFLDNAQRYFEAMQEIAQGQQTWTELRAKFGKTVAESIAKIRKINADFGSQAEVIDAKDRAAMLQIEQKRKHALNEVAADLNQNLQTELFRHQNKIASIEQRQGISQQRQSIQESLRQRRMELLQRVRYGSNQGSLPGGQIPVSLRQNAAPASGITATQTPGGNWFSRMWNGLGDR